MVTISGVGDYLIRQIRSAIPAPTVGLQVNSRADSAMETVLAVPDPDNQHPIVQENDVPDDIEVLHTLQHCMGVWQVQSFPTRLCVM